MLRWFLKSRKVSSYADAVLLDKYKSSGDNVYFGELFQRYTHLVFGLCMKYLSSEERSKDAVMDIFEQTLEKIKTQEVSNFKGWLYTVSKNHCLMILRKQKSINGKQEAFEKETRVSVEFEHELHLSNGNGTDELNVLNLKEVLKQLNKEQKQCIELFYLDGKSYKEVADITGYNLKEVKSHLQNGKRNLRIFLTQKTK